MAMQLYNAVRSWMFDSALPWWAANGVDVSRGGFVEQVTYDGADATAGFRRVRVACRQIYVFSHAHVLGWSKGLDLTAMGVDYLVSRAWQGPEHGFARRLDPSGSVIDPTPDLYDHAFVLFALAWRFKASADPAARDWLHRTLDFVESQLRHPVEGFWHWRPPTGPRQQNPHMHLTEAMLAAYEATGERRFRDLACELAGLFQRRFFDERSGALAEYFGDELGRADGEEGRIVEPGHQMEWAWILNAARRQLGLDTAAQIRALAAFAERHGVDPGTRAVYNRLRDDGAVIDAGSRTWPNTERLKAAVALYELDGVDPTPVFEASCGLLLQRYLATTIPGLWIDAFDANGRQDAPVAPASTLYHLFLAFAEVLRIGERLGADVTGARPAGA